MDMSKSTTEKLLKTRATLTTILKSFTALGLLIVILLCILKVKLRFFIPVFTLPIVCLPMILTLQSVNAELKSRASGNQ
jgi:hypothetical protein